MPDLGVPSPSRPASHTSTQQWQSFEIRMRHRRAERCLLRAQVALDAGFVEDAIEALEEARRLDPASPQIAALEQQIAAAPREGSLPLPAPARGARRMFVLAASIVAVAGALALQAWRPPDGVSPSAPRIARPDVVLPPGPRVTPVVDSVVVPAAGIREEPRPPDAPPPPADAPPPPADARAEPLPRIAEPSRDEPVATSAAPSPPPPPAIPVETGISASLAPPPVADTAPARVEPAPALPAVDERVRVRAVLARYEAAYSGLDASAARQVWPAVDERALERAFDGLASQRLSLGRCDLAVTGATARADCFGTASWTPKVGGGRRTENRRWRFQLARAGDDWQIVSATAR